MASHMPPPPPPPQQQQQQQPPPGADYYQPPPPPPSQLPPQNDNAVPITNYPPPQQPFVAPNHPPLIPNSPPPEQSSQFSDFPSGGGNQQPFSQASNDSNAATGDDSFAFKSPEPFYSSITRTINQRYQHLLDASTPHWAARWSFSIVLLLIFMARIIFAQGWYIICYGLSIYYLNLFIGFLSPKIDPAFREDYDFDDDLADSDQGPMLPTRSNDEFKPFIRRLPEFKFWLSATKATLISLFLTLFEIFDLPVFWPILLMYFILLFITTMRQQIRHMVKYGYVPWDKGKKKYGARKTEEAMDGFSTTI